MILTDDFVYPKGITIINKKRYNLYKSREAKVELTFGDRHAHYYGHKNDRQSSKHGEEKQGRVEDP